MQLENCDAYNSEEFAAAKVRLLNDPGLEKAVRLYLPDQSFAAFLESAEHIKNTEDFQSMVIAPVIRQVLKQSSQGMSLSGFENLDPSRRYLFISNHRDIICDPALLTYSLHQKGFSTPKICLGDNLLTHPLIRDLIKMNRGITVKRQLPMKDAFRYSVLLSEMIRGTITQGSHSVWIAQREGRAKDGCDTTHPGILKMLTLTGEGTLLEKLESLSLLPVAVSYEYDPCDALKARERVLLEKTGTYQKKPGEDQKSMLQGIHAPKGRIHIALGRLISFQASEDLSPKERLQKIAQAIDHEILKLYRLWPSHSIAYDLLHPKMRQGNYLAEEKEFFIKRMQAQIQSLSTPDVDQETLRTRFLESYACSLERKLASNFI